VRSGAGWSGITALSDATAGNGLVNIFTFDPSPLMKLNGSTRPPISSGPSAASAPIPLPSSTSRCGS